MATQSGRHSREQRPEPGVDALSFSGNEAPDGAVSAPQVTRCAGCPSVSTQP